MHSYLMTNDKKDIERVVNKMMSALDGMGVRALPIVLVTPLTDAVDTVRQILCNSGDPEIKRNLDTATDFHFSIFALNASDPDNARLMELH
jgi:hypothetical protein